MSRLLRLSLQSDHQFPILPFEIAKITFAKLDSFNQGLEHEPHFELAASRLLNGSREKGNGHDPQKVGGSSPRIVVATIPNDVTVKTDDDGHSLWKLVFGKDPFTSKGRAAFYCELHDSIQPCILAKLTVERIQAFGMAFDDIVTRISGAASEAPMEWVTIR